MENKKAILLLSGGMDSATVLAIMKNQDFDVYALSFDYGQRHKSELEKSRIIGREMGVKDHEIIRIDIAALGGSALTDRNIEVPHHNYTEIGREIPITYVPARNTIFLSFALAYAEIKRSYDIFIGVNALDYSGYPDCRPEYITAFERLANLATSSGVQNKGKFRIHTPLINMSKAEIIKQGMELGVDYSLTASCYDPDEKGRACGECDACLLRLKGFRENKVHDPVEYVK